jgi:hypothetical protein
VTASAGPTPARVSQVAQQVAPARSVSGCPDGGYICFYNYESFNAAGGIYVQYSGAANVCHVLPTSGISGWTNGKVYNATTSILLNWTGGNTVQRTIYFYDSNACSGSDYYFASVVYPGDLQTQLYRLANFGWNDRIGSWKVI